MRDYVENVLVELNNGDLSILEKFRVLYSRQTNSFSLAMYNFDAEDKNCLTVVVRGIRENNTTEIVRIAKEIERSL